MTPERMQQMVAAFVWANSGKRRNASGAVNMSGPLTLIVGEWRGDRYDCVLVGEQDGTDFDALLAEKIRKDEEETFARLKEKLGR